MNRLAELRREETIAFKNAFLGYAGDRLVDSVRILNLGPGWFEEAESLDALLAEGKLGNAKVKHAATNPEAIARRVERDEGKAYRNSYFLQVNRGLFGGVILPEDQYGVVAARSALVLGRDTKKILKAATKLMKPGALMIATESKQSAYDRIREMIENIGLVVTNDDPLNEYRAVHTHKGDGPDRYIVLAERQ